MPKVSISLRTSSKIQKFTHDAFKVEKTGQMHVDKATLTPKKAKKGKFWSQIPQSANCQKPSKTYTNFRKSIQIQFWRLRRGQESRVSTILWFLTWPLLKTMFFMFFIVFFILVLYFGYTFLYSLYNTFPKVFNTFVPESIENLHKSIRTFRTNIKSLENL